MMVERIERAFCRCNNFDIEPLKQRARAKFRALQSRIYGLVIIVGSLCRESWRPNTSANTQSNHNRDGVPRKDDNVPQSGAI